MKAYLLTTGLLFALIGTMHVATLVGRWRATTPSTEFVVENTLLAAMALGLAAWAFLLVPRARVRRI